ncbi:MAG: GDSL-type esterase/lipase family protein [Myxococcota bacterium]
MGLPRRPERIGIRRIAGWLVTAVGILLLSALVVEAALQGASLFVEDRASAWRAGAQVKILSVGDSHTYGSFVTPESAYPAQLESHLETLEPGKYSVINRGVPGMNTRQVRNRLPVWLSRYRPDVVIVWAGVNNSWNTSEMDRDSGSLLARIQGIATHSRLYRFVRVWFHDRELDRVVASGRAAKARQRVSVKDGLGESERWTVHSEGREEIIVHHREAGQENLEANREKVAAAAERDYALMVEQARSARADFVMITYPYNAEWFAVANRAMQRVSERYDVALVNSSASVKRLPEEQQELTWAAHPTAPMYREIARDIALHIRR